MRRRVVSILLILTVAGGLMLYERGRVGERVARMEQAVLSLCTTLRADDTAPIALADKSVSQPLRRALVAALATSGDLSVHVAAGGNGLATHEATVQIGGSPVIVLGVAESSAGTVLLTGYR